MQAEHENYVHVDDSSANGSSHAVTFAEPTERVGNIPTVVHDPEQETPVRLEQSAAAGDQLQGGSNASPAHTMSEITTCSTGQAMTGTFPNKKSQTLVNNFIYHSTCHSIEAIFIANKYSYFIRSRSCKL